MDTTDGRKLPESVLNERRRRAVKMRLSGATIAAAAQLCEIGERTVWAATKAYESGGWAAVPVRHGHRPKGTGRALTPEQEREVQRLIRDHVPDQLKMSYALWIRQAVRELILRRYDVLLAVRAVGNYLNRWGFTPQKPLKKAYEQSPQAVGKWLDEQYPAIAKRAKQESAEIHWGDETGLRSDDVRGRGYAPKGETPVLRIKNNRSSLSVISTVTNKGQMRWRIFSGALNARILIDFLKRLTSNAAKKIFLILDNLRVHHAKVVQQWLVENADKIEVFYLPSYSPELNPDKLLNADLKQRVTAAVPAKTQVQLVKTTSKALRSIQKQPSRFERYFFHPDVSYAA
jgi:transposase